MEQQRKIHHSGGFLLGLILGAIITLLFTTRKGRRIIKNLSREGFEKFGEWEGLIQDITDALDEEMVEEVGYTGRYEESPQEASQKSEGKRGQTETDEMRQERDTPVSKFTSSTRRFFRGVKKKV